MTLAIPLAWLQLKREKLRLLVALSGVGFAVVLIFMQLGFQDALFDSSVRYHKTFVYDLAMISPKTDFIVLPEGFSRRRLIQTLGVPGVESVAPVYLGLILPQAILVESFLGFMGLGVDEPAASWGSLLHEGSQELDTAPWSLLFPAGFLVATLASFQFLGDGLRDWLDVRGAPA